MDCAITITEIRDIIVGLAAISTAIVAWRGLSTWRRELKGKADFEVATNILQAVYATRMLVSRIRWEGTLPASYETHRENLNEERSKLFVHSQLGEALWGHKIRDAVLQLNSKVNELVVAISRQLGKGASQSYDTVQFLSDEAIVHQLVEHDQYEMELESAIDTINALILPKIRR